MKRIFLMFMVAMLALALSAFAQTQPTPKGWVYAGPGYTHAVDGKDGATFKFGVLKHVSGPLFLSTTGEFGKYGSWENKALVLTRLQPNSRIWIGLSAGGSGDFAVQENAELVAYLTGAGGLFLAYQHEGQVIGITNPGLWAHIGYKFKFDNAVTYYNGWTANLGINVPF